MDPERKIRREGGGLTSLNERVNFKVKSLEYDFKISGDIEN
jgi:hypothetical protein